MNRSIVDRQKHWYRRVEQVLYEGKDELHVTPEEFNDLRRLQADIEDDKIQREAERMRRWPELMRLNPGLRYLPRPPIEPNTTYFNSYSGAVKVVVDWPRNA